MSIYEIPGLDEWLESQIIPRCIGCNKTPEELDEYINVIEDAYEDEMIDVKPTATEYVRENEGTYNPKNGHFACTECYIKMGMPSSPTGWMAP